MNQITRSRWLFAPLFCVSMWMATPGEAQAQDELDYAFTAIFAGSMGLTFAVADVVYFAMDRVMPAGWAIPELIAGLTELAFGVAGFVLNASQGSSDGLYTVPGGFALGFGALHVTHAIVSLAIGEAPPASSPPVSFYLAPTAGGAMGGVGGSF